MRELPEFAVKMQEAMSSLKDFQNAMAVGPASYYLEKLISHSRTLLTEFAPFQIDDIAAIASEINCENGWKAYEHDLSIGKRGRVVDVDYRDNDFIILFEPENQTFLNPVNGEYEFVKNPGCFYISSKKLRHVYKE